ncbi:MAG: hypothetical protein PHC52_06340 [Syntrophales bacterium]|nr:hypothetical protein [Syntrophales bacterium]
MATPSGTIFAEIGIDYTPATKAQKQLLKDATSTSLNIEGNFKKLGIKSAAEFDLMRAKATNAFNMIKNSAKATADDILRAEKAKNEQLSRLNKQQFGEHKSLIDNIKSHWIAASVAVTAAIMAINKAVGKITDVAMAGARYETLGVVLNVVGRNAGYTSSELDKYSTALQAAGISMTESRQSAARMIQAQLDLSQATRLARIAQDAAVIGNINSSEAFQRLVYGIQSAQLEMLRTIGINVNFENSYAKAAKEMGRTTTSFSETEKAAIRMNAVVEAGAKIAGTYEAAMQTAGKQITSFPRYLEDFKVKMGEAFNPATSALVEAATVAMKSFQEEISRPAAQKALADISKEFAQLAISAGKDLPEALGKTIAALKLLMDLYNAAPSGVIGATGAGIIGRLLFGTSTAGLIAGGLYLINEELAKVSMSLGSLPGKYTALATALGNIRDVVKGIRDPQTGKLLNDFMQGGSAGKISGAGRGWDDPDAIAAAAREAERQRKAAEDAQKQSAEAYAKDIVKIQEKAYLKEMELFEEREKESADYLKKMKPEGGLYGELKKWVEDVRTSGKVFEKTTDEAGNEFFKQVIASSTNVALSWGELIIQTVNLIKDIVTLPLRVLDAVSDLFETIGNFPDMMNKALDRFVESIPKMAEGLARTFSEVIPKIIRDIPKIITAFIKAIPTVIRGIIDSFPEMIQAFIDTFIEGIPQIIAALAEAIVKAPIDMTKKIPGVGFISDAFGSVGNFIGDAFGSIGDVFGFKAGGYPGFPTANRYALPAMAFAGAPRAARGLRLSDGGIPIVAHPGERVLNQRETREYERGGKGLTIKNLQLIIGGKEFTGEMKVVADGVVVERNRRGINPTKRVYS